MSYRHTERRLISIKANICPSTNYERWRRWRCRRRRRLQIQFFAKTKFKFIFLNFMPRWSESRISDQNCQNVNFFNFICSSYFFDFRNLSLKRDSNSRPLVQVASTVTVGKTVCKILEIFQLTTIYRRLQQIRREVWTSYYLFLLLPRGRGSSMEHFSRRR